MHSPTLVSLLITSTRPITDAARMILDLVVRRSTEFYKDGNNREGVFLHGHVYVRTLSSPTGLFTFTNIKIPILDVFKQITTVSTL